MKTNKFLRKGGKSNFFTEMDYNNINKGCLTPKLFLYLLLIFVVIGFFMVMIITLGLNITINKSFSGAKLPAVPQIFKSQDEVAETYSVSLYDYDLVSILNSLNIPDTDKIIAHIRPENIKINGIYKKPIDLPIAIYAKPEVKDNKITVRIDDATLGGVRMIWLVNDDIRNSLASAIENYANSRVNGKITDIVLKEGELVLKTSP